MSDQKRKVAISERLSQHPVFRSLPPEAIAMLVAEATLFYLNGGETLYEANSSARHVFALLEGAVQIEYPKPGETRGQVVAMLSAPSFLGECQVLHNRPWSGTGVAIVPSVAIGIGAHLLERTMMAYPALGIALYREVTHRFLNSIITRKEEPVRSVEEQLARFMAGTLAAMDGVDMMVRPEDLAEGEPEDMLPYSQAVLGRATALRRETINRILARWEKDGVLKAGARGVTAIDRARLEGIAGATGISLLQRLDSDVGPELTLGRE